MIGPLMLAALVLAVAYRVRQRERARRARKQFPPKPSSAKWVG